MKLEEFKAGMKVVTTAPWADCWKAGKKFMIEEDHLGVFVICNGPPGEGREHHYLDGMIDKPGQDIPEFRPTRLLKAR